jgi:hypothetical protein
MIDSWEEPPESIVPVFCREEREAHTELTKNIEN